MSEGTMMAGDMHRSSPLFVPTDEAWKIDHEDLEKEKILGSGSFGNVYKGRRKDSDDEVALKELKNDAFEKSKDEEFRREIGAMMHLSSKHPSILSLIGFCTDPSGTARYMVLEYCERGSLYDVLQSHDEYPEFSWPVRLRAIRQVAQGVCVIHGSKFLHRDLKSPNIMLTADWQARIADFGMARYCRSEKASTLTKPENAIWTDPELLRNPSKTCDQSTDVYSFGIIMYEMLMMELPCRELLGNGDDNNGLFRLYFQLVIQKRDMRSFFQFPVDQLPGGRMTPQLEMYISLLYGCTNPDGKQRPSFKQIVAQLRRVIAATEELDALAPVLDQPLMFDRSFGWPSSTSSFQTQDGDTEVALPSVHVQQLPQDQGVVVGIGQAGPITIELPNYEEKLLQRWQSGSHSRSPFNFVLAENQPTPTQMPPMIESILANSNEDRGGHHPPRTPLRERGQSGGPSDSIPSAFDSVNYAENSNRSGSQVDFFDDFSISAFANEIEAGRYSYVAEAASPFDHRRANPEGVHGGASGDLPTGSLRAGYFPKAFPELARDAFGSPQDGGAAHPTDQAMLGVQRLLVNRQNTRQPHEQGPESYVRLPDHQPMASTAAPTVSTPHTPLTPNANHGYGVYTPREGPQEPLSPAFHHAPYTHTPRGEPRGTASPQGSNSFTFGFHESKQNKLRSVTANTSNTPSPAHGDIASSSQRGLVRSSAPEGTTGQEHLSSVNLGTKRRSASAQALRHEYTQHVPRPQPQPVDEVALDSPMAAPPHCHLLKAADVAQSIESPPGTRPRNVPPCPFPSASSQGRASPGREATEKSRSSIRKLLTQFYIGDNAHYKKLLVDVGLTSMAMALTRHRRGNANAGVDGWPVLSDARRQLVEEAYDLQMQEKQDTPRELVAHLCAIWNCTADDHTIHRICDVVDVDHNGQLNKKEYCFLAYLLVNVFKQGCKMPDSISPHQVDRLLGYTQTMSHSESENDSRPLDHSRNGSQHRSNLSMDSDGLSTAMERLERPSSSQPPRTPDGTRARKGNASLPSQERGSGSRSGSPHDFPSQTSLISPFLTAESGSYSPSNAPSLQPSYPTSILTPKPTPSLGSSGPTAGRHSRTASAGDGVDRRDPLSFTNAMTAPSRGAVQTTWATGDQADPGESPGRIPSVPLQAPSDGEGAVTFYPAIDHKGGEGAASEDLRQLAGVNAAPAGRSDADDGRLPAARSLSDPGHPTEKVVQVVMGRAVTGSLRVVVSSCKFTLPGILSEKSLLQVVVCRTPTVHDVIQGEQAIGVLETRGSDVVPVQSQKVALKTPISQLPQQGVVLFVVCDLSSSPTVRAWSVLPCCPDGDIHPISLKSIALDALKQHRPMICQLQLYYPPVNPAMVDDPNYHALYSSDPDKPQPQYSGYLPVIVEVDTIKSSRSIL